MYSEYRSNLVYFIYFRQLSLYYFILLFLSYFLKHRVV